jgi:hypothetical protein
MSCREYKSDLIEAARTGGGLAARRHAEACHECALFLEQQQNLTAWERALTVDALPPAYLEARLLDEYVGSRLPPRRRASARRAAWLTTGTIAAALILVWFAKPVRKQSPVVAARTEVPVRIAVTTNAKPKPSIQKRRHKPDADPPFLPIPYTQPLQPGERAEVVRMEMPVAALIAAGFPVATSDAGAEASADVIIGEDGRARAVRLISISERSIER